MTSLPSATPLAPLWPQAVARLMGLEESTALWSPADLAAILRHQLAAPLLFDLKREPGFDTNHLQQLATNAGIVSFADLLHHPHPPLELLAATKQFAKSSQHNPEAPLPPQIISLLYFTTILLAQTRCQTCLTTLPDETLAAGLGWCLNQPWLDKVTRELLQGL